MLRIINNTLLIAVSLLASCQTSKSYFVEGKDRVLLHDKDTLYEFYAVKLPPNALNQLSDVSAQYYWFDGSRIKVTRGEVRSRVLNGKYTIYYPDHNLKESGSFYKGLKDGEWKTWYPDGILNSKQSWKRGELHGTSFSYDSLGKVTTLSNYSKGLLSGKQLSYVGDSISSQAYYKDGKMVPPDISQTDSTKSK